MTQLQMWVGLSYCDGDWKQLSLAKRGDAVSAAVNDWAEETRGAGGAGGLRVDSPLYVGGVPAELTHPALESQSHRHGETRVCAQKVTKRPKKSPTSPRGNCSRSRSLPSPVTQASEDA